MVVQIEPLKERAAGNAGCSVVSAPGAVCDRLLGNVFCEEPVRSVEYCGAETGDRRVHCVPRHSALSHSDSPRTECALWHVTVRVTDSQCAALARRTARSAAAPGCGWSWIVTWCVSQGQASSAERTGSGAVNSRTSVKTHDARFLPRGCDCEHNS